MYDAIIVDDEPRTRQALIKSVDWKNAIYAISMKHPT